MPIRPANIPTEVMRHLHRVPYATVALAIAPVNLKRIASGPEGALLGKRPVASPQSFRERVCVRERDRRSTTMRRAAYPSGCARSGAGADCSAMKYQSLEGAPSRGWKRRQLCTGRARTGQKTEESAIAPGDLRRTDPPQEENYHTSASCDRCRVSPRKGKMSAYVGAF